MNPCIVLQIFIAMANVHSDTPANQNKISEAAQYQQKECQVWEKAEKKKAPEAKTKELDGKSGTVTKATQ